MKINYLLFMIEMIDTYIDVHNSRIHAFSTSKNVDLVFKLLKYDI